MGDTYSYFPAWAPGYPVRRDDCYQYGFSYKDSGGQFRSGNFYTCNDNYCHHENYRMTSGSANWYCGQLGDHCPQTYSGTAHYDPDVSSNSGWFGSKHKHPRAYPMGSEIKQCSSRDQYTWRWDAYQNNVNLTIATLQGGLDAIYPVLATCGPYNTGGVFIQEESVKTSQTYTGDAGQKTTTTSGANRIYLNFTPGSDGTVTAPSHYGSGQSYKAVTPGTKQNPDGNRDSAGGAPYALRQIDETKGRQWNCAQGYGATGDVVYGTGNANTWKPGAAVAPYQGDCLQTGAQKFSDASDLIGKALLPAGWHGAAADSYRSLATQLQQAAQEMISADKAIAQQIVANAKDLQSLQSSLYTQIVKCNDALSACLSLAQTDFNGEGILKAPSDGSAGYSQAVSTVGSATTAALQAQATYVDATTLSAAQVTTLSGQYETAQSGALDVSATCGSDFGSELFLENVTGLVTSNSWTATAASGNGTNLGHDFQTGWSSQSGLGGVNGDTSAPSGVSALDNTGVAAAGAPATASMAGAAGLASQPSSRSANSSGSSSMPVGLMAAEQGQQGSKSASAAGAAAPAPASAAAASGTGGAGSAPVDTGPADSSAEQQASPEPTADGGDGAAPVGDVSADSGPDQQQESPLQAV